MQKVLLESIRGVHVSVSGRTIMGFYEIYIENLLNFILKIYLLSNENLVLTREGYYRMGIFGE